MTEKEFHYKVQIAIDKVKTPNLLLEEHNHYANLAMNDWVKTAYQRYNTTQATSDELQVLKGIAYYNVTNVTSTAITAQMILDNNTPGVTVTGQRTRHGISFQFPDNYYHLLKCNLGLTPKQNFKCYEQGLTTEFTCHRLTDDKAIETNTYLKAKYTNPYVYIYNNNTFAPYAGSTIANRDRQPSFEIKTGLVEDMFNYTFIDVRYIRYPRVLNLTQSQLEGAGDTSNVMEFPDFICDEILKRMVAYVMERNSDPRTSSAFQVSNTNNNTQQ